MSEELKLTLNDLIKVQGIGVKTIQRIKEQFREKSDIPTEVKNFVPDIINNCELYQGDCLDAMDYLASKDIKVNAIIADPPYLHVKGGMKSKKYNVGTWRRESEMVTGMSDFGEKNIYEFLDRAIKLMDKVNMYIFCSKLQLVHYFTYISEHIKLKYDLLVWDKVKYSMKSTKFYTSDIEYVVRIYEAGVSLNKVLVEDGSKSDISYYMKRQSAQQPRGEHGTMKPTELLKKFIKVSTKENDLILDPFMGSGSTAIACINTNRNFIGIELDKEYYEIAKKRIKNNIKENN